MVKRKGMTLLNNKKMLDILNCEYSHDVPN